MDPNLYEHGVPAEWGNCHEVKLNISATKKKELASIPRGEEHIKFEPRKQPVNFQKKR